MNRTSIAALCASVGLLACGRLSAQEVDPRVSVGFEIAPVSLHVKGRNLALVGLGSYLVNATRGCGDCHAPLQPATSYEVFRDAIRTDSGRRAQAPSWPAHAALSELDLRAIYEYLRAMPATAGAR